MRSRILYFVFTFFICIGVFSQNKDRELANIIVTADKAFAEKNYYGAALLYEHALEFNSRMYDIVWKTAEAFRLDNDYINSRYYYKILVDNVLKSYPEALYYLAQMEKANEEYIKAQYFFNKYYEENKLQTNNILVNRAKLEILYCEYAWKMLNRPTGNTVENFDNKVNTIYSEFSPGFVRDSLFYFSSIRPELDSARDYRSRIFYSIIEDSIFSPVKEFEKVINMPDYDIANPFITQDGRNMYFSAMLKSYKSESHIYKSEYDFNNGKWSYPQKLPEKINVINYNSIHPFIAERHGITDILLWSSDRPDGEGGYDIWFCEIMPDGTYGIIRNLGRPLLTDNRFREFFDTTSTINTVGNEITPFFDVRDSLLYFSSDWYKGMGGYDIFSIKGNFHIWEPPVNLGYPVNTAQNDFYYKKFYEARYAVWTSNRKGSLALSHQSCCNDIYFYRLDEIIDEQKIENQRIEMITGKTKLLVPIELYFHNDQPLPRSWDTVTEINYSDSYYAYISLKDEFRTVFSRGLRRSERDAAIDSINYFFAEIVEANYNKLVEFTELIKQLLEEDQKIAITIKGYTSPLNTAEYNINLSKRRISSLVNFFYQYDDAYFLNYIEDGKISFEFVAFGKTMAAAGVSADPNDPRNSIYSPAASRERRIEIIAVSIEDERVLKN